MSELGTRRRPERAEPYRAVGTRDIHPVEKQHVEVDVEIQRTAEALNQRDRAGLGRLTGTPPRGGTQESVSMVSARSATEPISASGS